MTMFRPVLLSIAGLGAVALAAAVTPAAASPVTPLGNGLHAAAAPSLQNADYYYHHRHYRHRRWDRRHRHWYYY